MSKEKDFCIDHFSIITSRRNEATETARQLGFVTGDTYKNGSVHFVLDNSYFEVFYVEDGGDLVWLTNHIPAGQMPRIGSYRLSVGGTDARKAYDALKKAEIPGVGEINNPFTQMTKYGSVHAPATYQTIFIIGLEPFTQVLFGATTHLTKNVVLQPTRYQHTNGARRLESLSFYCETNEIMELADTATTQVFEAMKNVTEPERRLGKVILMSRDDYVAEFKTFPPERLHFPAVAATFSGCDLEYICEQADDSGLNHFEKDGKLYVDTRETLGIFMIFKS